jgi:hypothetical protein
MYEDPSFDRLSIEDPGLAIMTGASEPSLAQTLGEQLLRGTKALAQVFWPSPPHRTRVGSNEWGVSVLAVTTDTGWQQ